MQNEDQLNADIDLPLAIATEAMEWQESPAPGVHRKRLFRNGPAESGRVTSLVRYAPGSQFPSHAHPDGEEIYVLSGVFSDARGDWPAGSYLLNPEGFEHNPASAPGCELFVRLRQAPGLDRHQTGLLENDRQWYRRDEVDICDLWSQEGHPDRMRLERWQSAEALAERAAATGVEYLVLAGSIELDGRYFGEHSFFRVPPSERLSPTNTTPVTLLVREGGFELMA